ncbi:MAG: 7-cyano-7-deazaguanine synthase [Methanosarcinales archaeon Met12]|nr:MAG: 7-cyano-7-deazaguanine synthase [Methanosarcinales archaeon Met12]
MKLVSLISGGIDSPVATYLMMKKGVEVIALHLDNRPFTDEKQLDKSLKLVKHLENLFDKGIKTFVVPHGDNQAAFARNCIEKLQCVLCRRMMLRIAANIVEREGADGILTGESLGQVASQTLQNIYVTNQAVKTPIMRPLIGMDKVDIIDIARKIGTYDLSILPGLCCTIVPEKPSTAAKLEIVLREEEKVNIESLIEESMESARVVSC